MLEVGAGGWGSHVPEGGRAELKALPSAMAQGLLQHFMCKSHQIPRNNSLTDILSI